jgi:uncharacterized membrane protein YkvA (DUF1232 family)
MDTPESALPVPVDAPDWTPRDERAFWKKLARVVARVSFAEDLVAALYCALDRQTPGYVRATLLGALAYFLLPADTIPDFLMVLGFTDDAAVLAAAVAAVGRHLRPEHREAARERLDRLLAPQHRGRRAGAHAAARGLPRRRTRCAAEAGSPWVAAALRTHEARTFAQVAVVRSLVFAVLAIWIFANYGVEIGLQNLGLFALFAALGLAGYALLRGRPERMPLVYLLVVLDVLLLAYGTLAPGRTYPSEWPWQVVLRQPSFLYFLIFPALALLTFRPLLVFWSGVCVSLAWAAGTWLVALDPGALVGSSAGGEEPGLTEAADLAEALDPSRMLFDDAAVSAFVTLVVSLLLALAVWRARRLIYDEAEAARQRANLARYLAPSMVDRLARADAPLMGRARARRGRGAVRRRARLHGARRGPLAPGDDGPVARLPRPHGRGGVPPPGHARQVHRRRPDGHLRHARARPRRRRAGARLRARHAGHARRLEPGAGGGRGASARGRDRPAPRAGDDGRHRRGRPLRVRGDRGHRQRRQPAGAADPRTRDVAGLER